jgi:CBS domain-containing protein
MICPNCGNDNLPGSEECSRCQQDLTQLDQPIAQSSVERSLMEDPVRALNPHTPLTISPKTAAKDAVRIMLDKDVGALLVVDDAGTLVGIFSERDLLKRVASDYDRLKDSPVSDFMTPKPETVTVEDTLAFAVHKMDVGGYRHLPVLAEGRPTGVVSARDMLRHITRLCKEI